MINEGDYFIVNKSADGENVAIPVGTKQGELDDKFFPVRTADGFKVPCAVSGNPSNEDPFMRVNSADGERVAVPFGGGGGYITKPLFNYGFFSYFAGWNWNETTQVLSFPSTANDVVVGGMVMWGEVDENDIAQLIGNTAGGKYAFYQDNVVKDIYQSYLDPTIPNSAVTDLSYSYRTIESAFDVTDLDNADITGQSFISSTVSNSIIFAGTETVGPFSLQNNKDKKGDMVWIDSTQIKPIYGIVQLIRHGNNYTSSEIRYDIDPIEKVGEVTFYDS